MNGIKLPIWGLMGMVALVAMGAFALRSPSPLIASAAFTFAATVLIFATLSAIRGPSQTFWLGFAVVGWIYWFLAFGPHAGPPARPMLLTSRLLDEVYQWHFREVGGAGPQFMGGMGPGPPEWSLEAGDVEAHHLSWDWQRFQRIGHSLSVVVHGIGGGLILMVLDARGRRKRSA